MKSRQTKDGYTTYYGADLYSGFGFNEYDDDVVGLKKKIEEVSERARSPPLALRKTSMHTLDESRELATDII